MLVSPGGISEGDPTSGLGKRFGRLLPDSERLEEALISFDRTVARAPDDVNAWINKGLALFALRRYDDALEAYERALALDPENARASYQKGVLLNYRDGRPPEKFRL